MLADGFLEWRRVGKGKVPYRIVLKSGEPFAFAGIWQESGKGVPGFAIITTPANPLARIHDRMPENLYANEEQAWLENWLSLTVARRMLRQYASDAMDGVPGLDDLELAGECGCHWRIIGAIGLLVLIGVLIVGHASSVLGARSVPLTKAEQPLLVSVDVTVTYNSQTQRYAYAYKLHNLPTSTDSVDVFGLRQLVGQESITSPLHWRSFNGFQEDPGSVVWFPSELGPPPPGWVDDSVSVYTSAYAVLPGDSLTGFTIISPNAPGPIQYLARRKGPIRFLEEGPEIAPPFWSIGVIGNTTGPAVPIGIDEVPAPRPDQGLLRPAPNPFTDRTTITFDLSAPSDVELEVYDPLAAGSPGSCMNYALRVDTVSPGPR